MRSPVQTTSQGELVVPKDTARGGKNIWLTFDDGPHPSNTDRMLQTLDSFNIKATFFVIGKKAAGLERLVRKAFDAGHRIGNHSYTHADLTKMTEAQMRDEIKRTDDVINQYTGTDKIFRPPFGLHNATLDRVASQLGYRVVMWNVDTLDWNSNYRPHKWVQHGLNQIRSRNDSKILNHDIHETTVDNLPVFIACIKRLGNVTFKPPSTL
jgi:peptidoglycan-N-acetylglucosamine deacetylase